MRRLLVLIVGILGCWLGAATGAAATPTNLVLVHAYACDSTGHAAPLNATDTMYDAGDRRSNGTVMRPNEAASPGAYAYDRPTSPVHVVGVAATARRSAQAAPAASWSIVLSGVATNTADLVDVWRVVGPDEAAQIGKTGSYQVQLGGEGKYFFPAREQAENLGQMYTKQGWGGQQTLTRGQTPRSVIDRAEPVNAGTEGPGWFVRSTDVPSICNVTCVGPVG